MNAKYLFHICTLTEQQASEILHALRMVETDFEAEVPPLGTQLNYPPLVRNLYNNHKREPFQLMGATSKFPEKFSDKDIAALFEKQMEREIDGVTQIKSIEEEKLGKFDKTVKNTLMDWRERWKTNLADSLALELDEIRSRKRGRVIYFIQQSISLCNQTFTRSIRN